MFYEEKNFCVNGVYVLIESEDDVVVMFFVFGFEVEIVVEVYKELIEFGIVVCVIFVLSFELFEV